LPFSEFHWKQAEDLAHACAFCFYKSKLIFFLERLAFFVFDLIFGKNKVKAKNNKKFNN